MLKPILRYVRLFTYKMDSVTRSEAWQRLANLDGVIEESAVRLLDYLVIGNAGFVSGVKGNKSKKIKDAEENQLSTFPVQIVLEDFFMEFEKFFDSVPHQDGIPVHAGGRAEKVYVCQNNV